jgi:hypothetical protein
MMGLSAHVAMTPAHEITPSLALRAHSATNLPAATSKQHCQLHAAFEHRHIVGIGRPDPGSRE